MGIGILSAGGAALQWLALVGPFEGLGHGAVEVVYKSFQSLLQIGQRGKVAAADDLAGQDAEPNFDLVHPGGMFGSVTKVNPMGGIVQEASAADLSLKHALLALGAQVDLPERGVARHVADQAFGLVSVEVVQDKGELMGLRVGLHEVVDQVDKINFGARGPTEGPDLAGGHVHARQQREGAMAFILKLAPYRLAGLHGVVWRDPCQGLNAGHLVDTEGQLAVPGGRGGLVIDLA